MVKTKTISIIGGPTASGKSALALEVAAEKNGVIVNADSMQVYNRLPILTAQPSESDKVQVPHALYGVMDPNESCSAGNWREVAEPVIEGAFEAGQTPVIVGGSGLYIKALLEGLSPIPDIPDDIRQAASEKQKELENPGFHAALQERDPEMAVRFHPYHTARLVRAWEVLEATGKSLAEWQKEPRIPPPKDWVFEVTLVMPERDVLYERCNTRFLKMLDQGGWEEIEIFDTDVKSGDIRDGALLTKALGVKPLRAYLAGKISKEEAIEKAQAETRQYAKRQVTWFRHQIKEQKNVATITVLP